MNFMQRIKDGAGRASERAQSAVEIGRLNSHISDIQREIDVHFLRMGQIFYENYSKRDMGPAEEEIMELCTVCDLLNEEIAGLRFRIADLRGERLCECGARLDADAAACPHCGRQLAPEAQTEAPAASKESVESVPPGKEPAAKPEVEAEAVHDLVDDPDFGPDGDGQRGEGHYEIPPHAAHPLGKERSEDEQFETKRFDLGRPEEAPEAPYAESEPEDVRQREVEYGPSGGAAVPAGEEETREQREERQRRELREIRARERRKMKEGVQPEEPAVSGGEDLQAEEDEEPGPTYDPEHERRQRERIEREKERQDELDRLIASWGRVSDRTAGAEEELIVRRPVGEVVRCQVCGSGLPKGSKWCPHCASEQI